MRKPGLPRKYEKLEEKGMDPSHSEMKKLALRYEIRSDKPAWRLYDSSLLTEWLADVALTLFGNIGSKGAK
jgi:hypothetical protein